jgi:hypothetical protein
MAIAATTRDETEVLVVAYGPESDQVIRAVDVLASENVRTCTIITDPDAENDAFSALNYAISTDIESGANRQYYAIVGEETQILPGWESELVFGLDATEVLRHGDDAPVPRGGYGKIGIVGPVSLATESPSQLVTLHDGESAMTIADYAMARQDAFSGVYSQAESIDWRCMVIAGDLVREMGRNGRFFDHNCGRFVSDDLAIRADRAGYRAVVAEAVVVPAISPVRDVTSDPPHVADRLHYYAKYAARSGVVTAITVHRFQQLVDLLNLRRWVERHANLVDSVHVVIANNPLDLQTAHGFDLRRLSLEDRAFLTACDNATVSEVCTATRQWLRNCANDDDYPVTVDIWLHPPNERLETRFAVNGALKNPVEPDGERWILHVRSDELVEPRVTKNHILRLCTHPNPNVKAWDFGIRHHWETPQLVREDPPWGDGGTYDGGSHGVRLWRHDGRSIWHDEVGGAVPAGPAFGPESLRTAGIRLRSFGMMTEFDRARRTAYGDKFERMQLTKFNPANGVGLHMLTYHREHAEDVARWLDDIHGLIDEVVLVWTDPADVERSHDFDVVASRFGARWVAHELNDNIAEARNAGIDELGKNDRLGWALFFDPDEWLGNRESDCRSLRRMADSPNRWGWLLRVENPRADGAAPTISDSMRMSRLDAQRTMRMSGRVHEGFGESIKRVQTREHPGLLYAPFMLKHRGMAFDASRMGEKLDHYESLLRLELGENPHNPGAWVSLGWHYANDGHLAHAVECYNRGIQCAGQSYLPFKELTFFHLREARALMEMCRERLVDTHPFAKVAADIGGFLDLYAPPHPIIRANRPTEPAPLPAFTAPETDEVASTE